MLPRSCLAITCSSVSACQASSCRRSWSTGSLPVRPPNQARVAIGLRSRRRSRSGRPCMRRTRRCSQFDRHLVQQIGCAVHVGHVPQYVAAVHMNRGRTDWVEVVGGHGLVGSIPMVGDGQTVRSAAQTVQSLHGRSTARNHGCLPNVGVKGAFQE